MTLSATNAINPAAPSLRLRPVTGRLEAFTISLSAMAPTLAMSFTTPFAAASAGAATPLAYLSGGVAIAVAAFSFIAFSRRFVGAGSAMTYLDAVFGPRVAFIAGWTLLLAYLAFVAGSMFVAGSFAAKALAHLGFPEGSSWIVVAAAIGVAMPWLASRRLATVSHLVLMMELLSVAAIIWLVVVILGERPAGVAAPFAASFPGAGRIGAAMVFSILAFGGFEAATTVSEETINARRAIPFALIVSVAVVTGFHVLVSYAQVAGFGGDGAALAAATAPLDVLSSRYVGGGFGLFLDIAATVSAFACALSLTTAAARMLYALGRAGLDARLSVVDLRHGTPRAAIAVVAATSLALLAVGCWRGVDALVAATMTTGTLALIVTYIAVCVAQAVFSGRARARTAAVLGWTGAALLLWPLFSSVRPAPGLPVDPWPYLVVGWIVAGAVLAGLKRGIDQSGEGEESSV